MTVQIARTFQNRVLLERFWSSAVDRNAETRMALLRGYARTALAPDPFRAHDPKWTRRHFAKETMAGRLRRGDSCWICEGRSEHRHHIIPVESGGRNIKRNIVPLCGRCHRRVHARQG